MLDICALARPKERVFEINHHEMSGISADIHQSWQNRRTDRRRSKLSGGCGMKDTG